MAGRALPRKPSWLEVTPQQRQDEDRRSSSAEAIARVLEFPASTVARRPAPAAATAAASKRQLPTDDAALRRLPASTLRIGQAATAAAATTTTGPSSVLAPEPAYRSALSRLSLRPGSTPGTAAAARPSTAAAAGSVPPAAPALPSTRLDQLLSGRHGQAARPPTAPPPSSRLDELLSGRRDATLPSSSCGEATLASPMSQPTLPSSRLDQLLSSRHAARPAAAVAAAAGDERRSSGQREAGSGTGSLLQARAPTAAPSATLALSPVEEEGPAPSSSLATSLGRSALRLQTAGGSSALVPAAAAARTRPAPAATSAGTGLDPGLQERLRERIEVAKAQIRQQLNMFRLSEALVGAEHDPQRAADALDAATGVSTNGFELLARRPGSRGAGGGAGSVGASSAGAAGHHERAGQGLADKFLLLSEPGQQGVAGSSMDKARAHEQQEAAEATEGRQRWLEQQQPSGSARAAATFAPCFSAAIDAAESGPGSAADEVDSLVANARAAAARAQSALAELASPPRPASSPSFRRRPGPGGSASRTVPAAGSVGRLSAAMPPAAGSAPRQAAPLPYSQLTVVAAGNGGIAQMQEDRGLLSLAQHGQQLLAVKPLAGAELQAWVGQLRLHSEELIRTECEKLVASMHRMFDGFLGGEVPQQLQYEGRLAGQGSPAVAAEEPSARDSRGGDHLPSVDGSSSSGTAAGSACSSPRSDGIPAWLQHQRHQHQPGAEEGEQEALQWGGDTGSGDAFEAVGIASCSAPNQETTPQDEQRLLQQQQQQGSAGAASPPSAAEQQLLPEQRYPTQLAGGGFAGFGSPIRLFHSPAKVPGGSLLGRQPAVTAAGAGAAPASQQQQQQQQRQQPQQEHTLLGSAARSLSLGGPLPLASGRQTTPAFGGPTHTRTAVAATGGIVSSSSSSDGGSSSRGPAFPLRVGSDPYLTARSTAAPPLSSASSAGSGDVFDSPRSFIGSEGGGSSSSSLGPTRRAPATAAATAAAGLHLAGGGGIRGSPPAAQQSQQLQPSPLLRAGGKDLDSIVGSIRRLAAELRLKQGLPSTPPTAGSAHAGTNLGADGTEQRGSASSRARALTPASMGAGLSSRNFRTATAGSTLYTAGSAAGGGSSGSALSVHRKPLR